VNIVIAVSGLALLGWLFTLLRQPDWTGELKMPVVAYSMAQFAPLALLALYGVVRCFKLLVQPSQEAKRTAILQRRGLFDFVSPIFVFVAVLGYFLFAAFVVYIQRLSPDFHGLITLGVITLIYALTAFILYITMYGKYRNPFETHVDRLQTMGTTVKGSVYSCIGIVVYLSIILSLGMLDLTRWVPFATSVFFVICTLLDSIGPAPLRKPEANELGESPAK